MSENRIEIVDRGRGLQLSTSRITVQDVVPYFQKGYSREGILRWMPALTAAELAVLERYYAEHKAELDEEDRRIRARTAERIRLQRQHLPDEPREVRLARMRETLRRRQVERNGEGDDVGLAVLQFEDIGLPATGERPGSVAALPGGTTGPAVWQTHFSLC